VGKRQKFKQCFRSTGQKIVSIAKSRVVARVLPLFVLVAIFKPNACYAFNKDYTLQEQLGYSFWVLLFYKLVHNR